VEKLARNAGRTLPRLRRIAAPGKAAHLVFGRAACCAVHQL